MKDVLILLLLAALNLAAAAGLLLAFYRLTRKDAKPKPLGRLTSVEEGRVP